MVDPHRSLVEVQLDPNGVGILILDLSGGFGNLVPILVVVAEEEGQLGMG